MATTGDRAPAPRPAPDAAPALDREAARRLLPQGGEDPALRRLTDLAARLLSVDGQDVSVQVSLLTELQTVPAATGAPTGTSDAADSLCSVTVRTAGPLVVPDTTADDRVAQLAPVATGRVGSYLGVPLHDGAGARVGALCAFAASPRSWTPHDLALLEELGSAVAAQLELSALSAEYASSQVRWDVALDAAGVGSFDLDLRTQQLAWDDRMQELFGYARGEFRGDLAAGFERVDPRDRPVVEAAVAEAVETVGDYSSQFRVLLPDGRQRWVLSRGRALRGEDGAADRLVGAAQDVTELREARDEAARLLETMSTGFLSLDRDWRITYVNGEGARVVGRAAAELVGRDVWTEFPGLRESAFGQRYEQAVRTGEPAELEAYYAHLDGWFDVRAVPTAEGLSLFFVEVSARRRDQEAARAATGRLELLARVSTELVDAGLDVEGAVARLARLCAPVLGDWALVTLVDGGSVRDVGWWHGDPAQQEVLTAYVEHRLHGRSDLGAVDRARRTRQPVIVERGVTAAVVPTLGSPQAQEALTALAAESIVVVPLVARDHMTGVLTLVRGPDRPPASAEEIATAREIANRAALALDNARLYEEQRSLAEGLQRSLLTTPPQPDHCHIAVRYVPAARAAQVGGDWYDAFLQADGATVLVIGDVMGHDTDAAAAMGQLRGLTRGIAWHSGGSPARVLESLDAAMQGLQVETTATAVVARLEQTEQDRAAGLRRLRWANAGHPPPMLVSPRGEVQVLDGGDLLLGLDPGSPRVDHVLAVEPGSTVVLYTDGLVERRDQDLDTGLALLRERLAALADRPLEDLCDELLRGLLPREADDDVALVLVRLHPQDRPRPVEAGPVELPEQLEPGGPGQAGGDPACWLGEVCDCGAVPDTGAVTCWRCGAARA